MLSGLKILVLNRGWVVVGDVTHNGAWVTVTNGAVVRRWGTQHGLGELAAQGPLANTILDSFERVSVHELGIVAAFDCNTENWKGEL
jgi:hypothetical protein